MKEVLLPIGTIIKGRVRIDDDLEDWMIIGRRAVNPDTGKAWDYVSVPHPEGYVRSNAGFPNFYYFNHYEIEVVVSVPDDYEQNAVDEVHNCNHKECPICNGEYDERGGK